MPATPVARVQIVPSIVPNTQNPMLPPTIGAITLFAQNPAGQRLLSDLSEVLPSDTSIVAVVDIVGPSGPPAWVFMQNRKKTGSNPPVWNTTNPVYVQLASDGTYDLTFTITGDSDNSTITNFTAVKRP